LQALERLLAYEEIRQLAAHYAAALDARDLDRLVALFVPDVRVGRHGRGREALRASFDQQLRAIGVSFLLVGGHAIDLESADRASGVVSCKAEIEVSGRWVHQAIQYHDRYARHEDRWLFVRRRHLLVYGQAQRENPLEQPPARWPERHEGRGTVPWELDSWKRFFEK